MKLLLTLGCLLTFLLLSLSAKAQLTMRQDNTNIKGFHVVLTGTFSHENNTVVVKTGPPLLIRKGPTNFLEFSTTLRKIKNYSEAELSDLLIILKGKYKDKKSSPSSTGDLSGDLSNSNILDVIVLVEEKRNDSTTVNFAIFEVDKSNNISSDTAFKSMTSTAKNGGKGGCEQISKSCIRCPNGIIYCKLNKK